MYPVARWSVSRVLSKDDYSSRMFVAKHLKQPTRAIRSEVYPSITRYIAPIWSCSRWGLPCRFCYQKRGALLPHLFTLTNKLAVYFLWHFPWGLPRRTLSATLLLWSPDFPLHRKLYSNHLTTLPHYYGTFFAINKGGLGRAQTQMANRTMQYAGFVASPSPTCRYRHAASHGVLESCVSLSEHSGEVTSASGLSPSMCCRMAVLSSGKVFLK